MKTIESEENKQGLTVKLNAMNNYEGLWKSEVTVPVMPSLSAVMVTAVMVSHRPLSSTDVTTVTGHQ